MPERLFKFKSLTNFEHVSDILQNERFYAAKFFDLNDPMEGRFDHDPDLRREFLDEIVRGKQKLRICSFSRDLGNLLLWAHYADSYRGICIEVEAAPSPNFEIVDVGYSPFSVIVTNDYRGDRAALPRHILSGKNEVWEYEREVRLLSSSEFITSGVCLKAVYLGIRTSPVLKNAIAAILPKNVPIYETTIGPATNRVEQGAQYPRRRARRPRLITA